MKQREPQQCAWCVGVRYHSPQPTQPNVRGTQPNVRGTRWDNFRMRSYPALRYRFMRATC